MLVPYHIFLLMAFVPLCIFLITIFGFILGYYEGFYDFFSGRLMNLFPEITSEITDELRKLIKFKGIGTFSIILYGILSYQVFASLENALNIIFKVKKKRNFLLSINCITCYYYAYHSDACCFFHGNFSYPSFKSFKTYLS